MSVKAKLLKHNIVEWAYTATSKYLECNNLMVKYKTIVTKKIDNIHHCHHQEMNDDGVTYMYNIY